MSAATRGGLALALTVAILAGGAEAAEAQHTVKVSAPAGVSFLVSDVTSATTGSPDPTVVTFVDGTWPPPNGRRFRISVQADAANFTPPAGGAIPASHVSWTASSSSGTASHGSLSSTAFTQVLRTGPNTPTGSVSMTWTLEALNAIANLRAGTHVLTVRWRLELQ